MTVEICAVAGYSDFGRNMTAVRVNGEAFLIDIGLHIEKYVQYTEDEDFAYVDPEELMAKGAAPDVAQISDWAASVKAIIPSHAHLDHLGAAPFLAGRFNAPIVCTPFTAEVLRNILKSEEMQLPNKIVPVQMDREKKLTAGVRVELLNMTHSTPHTAAVVLHTPAGVIIYMCDFKLDPTPVLGAPSSLKRLEELGRSGVLALILDSTNAKEEGRTPSEAVAKDMLNDVLAGIRGRDTGIIVTTFSSHLARLKSIMDAGKKLNRKVLFLGRSMARYIEAGEAAGVVKFGDRAQVFRFGNQIERALKKVAREGKGKYLLVVSGHQGEPKSTLSKMVAGRFEYRLDPRDVVVFSCRVIPTATNVKNRELMERTMHKQGVHLFRDVHQSGHGAKEDVRDVLRLLKPKHLIPAHGTKEMRKALAGVAKEEGIRNVHMLSDGERVGVQ